MSSDGEFRARLGVLTVQNAALRREVSVLAERANRRQAVLRQLQDRRQVPVVIREGVAEWEGMEWVPRERLEGVAAQWGRSGHLASTLLVAHRIWEKSDTAVGRLLDALDGGDVANVGYARSRVDYRRQRRADWQAAHREEVR